MEEKRVNLVKEALKDGQFVKQLAAAFTPEEAQKALASRGIDCSIDEAKAISAAIRKGVSKLSEEDLDKVSGGIPLFDSDIQTDLD